MCKTCPVVVLWLLNKRWVVVCSCLLPSSAVAYVKSGRRQFTLDLLN
jgi:hypothetical protein